LTFSSSSSLSSWTKFPRPELPSELAPRRGSLPRFSQSRHLQPKFQFATVAERRNQLHLKTSSIEVKMQLSVAADWLQTFAHTQADFNQ